MNTPLKQYAADHRYLLETVARQAGITNPVAINLDEYEGPLLTKARAGQILPVDGVLVRDWNPHVRQSDTGVQIGARLYDIEGVRFVRARFQYSDWESRAGLDFLAVDRKDYRRLYRIALRCRRDAEPPSGPPVLPAEQRDVLWKNTIGYLDPDNLRQIKAYGGRARRGVLLMGPPGNGKTMACRWLWEACRQRRWEWRLVTPDTYKSARESCNPVQAVRELFTVVHRGIVFFDDMDLALRDRETVRETDDQAVFLSAMDGITISEGVVFLFTTNCGPELIDRAFKRPGRLDIVLHFEPPTAELRRQLLGRWHDDIRKALDLDAAVAATEGYSFAEIEELKNLLILRFMESRQWDWLWALEQFDLNRRELAAQSPRRVGFGHEAALAAHPNGKV